MFKLDTAQKKKIICGIVVSAMVPLLSACSNNQGSEKSRFSFFKSERVSSVSAIPEQKPVVGAGDNLEVEKVDKGSHAVGQNFASVSSTAPATNVISNQTKFSSKTFGVAGSPRVANTIEVRKGGGRYHVGKPYSIRGIRYYPKEDPNYRAVGLASWYGPNFHGRLTANGEVYDQFALSAAHPTMPLPSYARVTNLENGSSLVVRVNDRGPFARGRVIDLSSRAAQLLGYSQKGIAKVKVEYVGKARMDGLDEEQLLASYHPGQMDPSTIPANPGRAVAVASAEPRATKPSGQRKTLDAFVGGLFKTNSASGAQDVSALGAVRPVSLVNGYDAERRASAAESQINTMTYMAEMASPRSGMRDLSSVEIGPITSKAELFELSELASDYGAVSIVPADDKKTYHLHVILPSEDVGVLRSKIK